MSTQSSVPNTDDDDTNDVFAAPSATAGRLLMGGRVAQGVLINPTPVKPLLLSATPADDLSSVAVTSDIVLHFNTSMLAGSGSIVISDGRSQSYVSSNGTLMSRLVGATDTRSISVSDSQITINGQDVTIHLNSALKAGTSYSVTMADGALQSTDYLSYAGLATATQLNFTTATSASRSAPVAAVSGAIHFNDNGVSGSDYLTSNTSQAMSGSYSGTLASGDFIQVSLDNGASWSKAVADSSLHTWSYSGTIAGSSSMLARVANTYGLNSGTVSNSFVLDTTAPTAYVSGAVTLSADSGSSASDLVTNVAAQTISGHYTGTIAADEVLAVSLDNGITWGYATVYPGTNTWSYAATLTGSSKLLMRVMDVAGNFLSSSEQPVQQNGLAYSYTAGTSLAGHALTLAAGSDTGTANDNITSAVAGVTLNVAGLANLHVGDVIRILDTSNNSAVVGSYTLGAIDLDHYGTGHLVDHGYGDNITTLNIGVSGLGNGAHTLVAQVFDIAGNLTATPTSALSVTVTSSPPGAPISLASATVNLQPDAANDSGSSHSDNITNTTLPAIVANMAGITLHVGDVVQLLDDGNLIASKTLVSGDLNNGAVIGGTLTFTPGGALAEGTHSMTVRALDSNSTPGTPSNATVVTIDTTPLSLANAIVDLLSDGDDDTGVSQIDNISNNTQPLILADLTGITGLHVGDTVQLLDNGAVIDTYAITADLFNGENTLTYPLGFTHSAPFSEGTHSLTVRLLDAAGNIGTASDATDVIIDLTPPGSLSGASVGLLHTSENDTGSSSIDNRTKQPSPTVAASLAGVNDLHAGDIVQLLDGSAVVGSVVLTGDMLSNGAYNGDYIEFHPELSEGPHQLSVRLSDLAGNTGTANTPTTVTIDTTAVSLNNASAGLVHNASNDTGADHNDNITSNKQPAVLADLTNVSGLQAGDSLLLLDGETVIGHKVLQSSDLNAGAIIGGSVAFTIDTIILPTGLADGDHQLRVGFLDIAGNTVTGEQSTTVTVMSTPPSSLSEATVALTHNAANDSGSSTSDNLTNVAQPLIRVNIPSVHMRAGDTLQLLDGANVVQTYTITSGMLNGDGYFSGPVSLTASAAFSEGAHSLTVRLLDIAGNLGTASAATTVTVDLTPSPVSLANVSYYLTHDGVSDTGSSSDFYYDDLTSNTRPVLRAELGGVTGLQAGDMLQLVAANGDVLYSHTITSGELSAGSLINGAVDFRPDAALADGVYNLSVRVADAAGNGGTARAPVQFQVLTAAPSLSGVTIELQHDAANDTGVLQNDCVTSQRLPTLQVDLHGLNSQGALHVGDVLQLMSNSNTVVGHKTLTSADLSGNGILDMSLDTSLNAVGANGLSDGVYQLSVRLLDIAGNRADDSQSTTIEIDASAPILSSSTPANNATAVDAATGDLTLTFSEGVHTAGTTAIRITDNSGYNHTVQVSNSDINASTLTVHLDTPLADGTTYYVSVAQGALQDDAGNSADATLMNFHTSTPVQVDPPPDTPDVTLHFDSYPVSDTNGDSLTHRDLVTNDPQVDVGSLSHPWSYSLDGGTSWAAGTGSSFNLTQASYAADAIQVKQTYNSIDSEIAILNPGQALVVDLTGPAASIDPNYMSFVSGGTSVSGHYTGSVDPDNEIVEVTFNHGADWVTANATTPVSGTATWSVSVPLAGTISEPVGVRIVDLAGNSNGNGHTGIYPTYYGSPGNDTVAWSGQDHIALLSGAGNDTITVGDYAYIVGGNGTDSITAGNHATITTGSGINVIYAGNDSHVNALDGATIVVGNNATVTAGNYANVTTGTFGDVTVNGGATVMLGGGSTVTVQGDNLNLHTDNGSHSIVFESVSAMNTALVVAGTGNDTLNLGISGNSFSLSDLSASGHMSGIEIITLFGGGNTITVGNTSDVTDFSGGSTLVIESSVDGNTVHIDSAIWYLDHTDSNHAIYHEIGNTAITLLVGINIGDGSL